jgi:hypothetical protein
MHSDILGTLRVVSQRVQVRWVRWDVGRMGRGEFRRWCCVALGNSIFFPY